MSTIEVSLPEEMRAWVEEEAKQGGFASPSEYVSDLLGQARVARARQEEKAHLKELLLEGLNSGPGEVMDGAWLEKFQAEVWAEIEASKAPLNEQEKAA